MTGDIRVLVERLWHGSQNALQAADTIDALQAELARLTAERDTARAETDAKIAAAYADAADNVDGIEGYSNAVPRHRIRERTPAHATAGLSARDTAIWDRAIEAAAQISDEKSQSYAEQMDIPGRNIDLLSHKQDIAQNTAIAVRALAQEGRDNE